MFKTPTYQPNVADCTVKSRSGEEGRKSLFWRVLQAVLRTLTKRAKRQEICLDARSSNLADQQGSRTTKTGTMDLDNQVSILLMIQNRNQLNQLSYMKF